MTHFSSHVSLGGSTSNGSWMWSINIPQHIKFFLWLTSHKSFPTNTFLTFRHLSTDEFCCRCLDQEETILHILRDSQKAQQVWHFFHHALQVDFMEQDNTTWLQHHRTGPKGLMFPITCWFIQRCCNSFIFNNEDWKNQRLLFQVFATLDIVTHQRRGGNRDTQLSISHGVCHH